MRLKTYHFKNNYTNSYNQWNDPCMEDSAQEIIYQCQVVNIATIPFRFT